ncbi:MAG: TIGR02302 family protein [Pseudomonadota bacterium]
MKAKRAQKSPDQQLDAKIRRARWVLLWERFWSAVFPLLCIAGTFFLAAISGVLEWLPREAHFAVLGLFLVASGAALRPLFALRMPGHDEALKRIESVSGLPHQPASSYRDEISAAPAGSASRRLWQVHKERLARLIASLKAGWPRSGLAGLDPFGLRYALVMAIGAFFVLNAGDVPDRIERAVSPAAKAKVAMFLDAWVAPPEYTGKAPLFLSRGKLAGAIADDQAPRHFRVATGSELVLRLNGALDPVARIEASGNGQAPEISKQAFKITGSPAAEGEDYRGARELRLTLDRPVEISVVEQEDRLASWTFTLIPDEKPKIKISELDRSGDGSLRFSYETSDDYGVREVTASFKLAEEADPDKNLALNSKLFPAPDFGIDLPRVDPKTAKGKVYRDLAAHPWAGMKVEMRVRATDAAGQASDHEGAPQVLVLPEREFTEPLARAIVEQRKALIRNTDDAALVSRVIDGFTIYPQGMIKQSGVFLGLRLSHQLLVKAENDEAYRDVVDLLWNIALTVEDGNLSDAARELRRLRRELAKALSENASPEKISELMQKMREAMNRYMREMAKQMQRNMREGRNQQQRARPDQVISNRDLQRMMDQIEKLARAGEHEAAQKLLSELERIMENMRPGTAQQSPQRETPHSRALQELGELMRRQQELMDQTFRMQPGQQGQQGQQNQRGQQQGGEYQDQQGRSGRSDQLARQQGGLGDVLRELMESLRDRGINPPNSLGEAQGEMRGAEGALREGERGEALGRQGKAMNRLRDGMQAMAQEMMRQGTGNQGNFGRHEGHDDDDDFDPLGRPAPTTGEQRGPRKEMVPGEAAAARAREILRALRDRYSDPGRRKLELDYLERLLRNIY